MEDIAKRCIEIIAKAKSIPEDSITLESTFDELNADSLDKINTLLRGRGSLRHRNPPTKPSARVKTVGDMVDGVQKLVAAKPSIPTP